MMTIYSHLRNISEFTWKTSLPSVLLFMMFSQPSKAQNDSWRSSTWQVGAGRTFLYDDYISPVSYNAGSMRVSWEFFRPIGKTEEEVESNESKWYEKFELHFVPAATQTNSGSWFFHLQGDIQNTVFYQFAGDRNWYLRAGGYLGIRGGGRFVYQDRNNPGTADMMTDIGGSFMGGYRFRLWNRNMHFRYVCSLPIVGLAFAPEYTESYYEIFSLNNYKNTVKFTSLDNRQQWIQQFSLDIPLSKKKSSIRLSYWNEGRITNFNDLDIRIISDQFSIGYIKYFKVL